MNTFHVVNEFTKDLFGFAVHVPKKIYQHKAPLMCFDQPSLF